MEFLSLEHALNNLAKATITKGRMCNESPFEQYAGYFSSILRDTETNPEQKAQEIADIINEVLRLNK